MRITLKGTGVSLTPAIRKNVEKAIAKVEKLIDVHEPSALLRVEVSKTTKHHRSGNVWRAELNLGVKKKLLRAEETREDLYDALFAASQELRRRYLKYRDTRGSSFPRSPRRSSRE